MIEKGRTHQLGVFLIVLALINALHLIAIHVWKGDVASLIYDCLPLVDQVLQDVIRRAIVLILVLKLVAPLHEGVDLRQLLLHGLLLQPRLLLLIIDLPPTTFSFAPNFTKLKSVSFACW